jgi:hypothetical protein
MAGQWKTSLSLKVVLCLCSGEEQEDEGTAGGAAAAAVIEADRIKGLGYHASMTTGECMCGTPARCGGRLQCALTFICVCCCALVGVCRFQGFGLSGVFAADACQVRLKATIHVHYKRRRYPGG